MKKASSRKKVIAEEVTVSRRRKQPISKNCSYPDNSTKTDRQLVIVGEEDSCYCCFWEPETYSCWRRMMTDVGEIGLQNQHSWRPDQTSTAFLLLVVVVVVVVVVLWHVIFTFLNIPTISLVKGLHDSFYQVSLKDRYNQTVIRYHAMIPIPFASLKTAEPVL